MKNKRRIIGIVAATLLALVGTISLVGYVRSAKDDAVAQEALVDVYVVDEFVPKGADPETIKSSVSIEQVPARLKQDDAITDLEQVGEQVAAADLQVGDQLLAARLAAGELVSDRDHRQGADLRAARSRTGRRRSDPSRATSSACTSRSIPSSVDVSGSATSKHRDRDSTDGNEAAAIAAVEGSTDEGPDDEDRPTTDRRTPRT